MKKHVIFIFLFAVCIANMLLAQTPPARARHAALVEISYGPSFWGWFWKRYADALNSADLSSSISSTPTVFQNTGIVAGRIICPIDKKMQWQMGGEVSYMGFQADMTTVIGVSDWLGGTETTTLHQTVDVSSFRVMGRVEFHPLAHPVFDPYLVAAGGGIMRSSSYTSRIDYDTPIIMPAEAPIWAVTHPITLRAGAGLRCHVGEVFTLSVEGGLGGGAVVSGGIACRIPSSKAASSN